MKSTKKSLFTSVLALFLCFSMLLGTTFAWFTDTVTSTNNKIVAGSLKVDLELFDKETGTWESIKNSQKAIFNHKNWEPGYTEVKILRITNKGSLALKWDASIIPLDELTALADVIDVYVYSGKTAPNARPDRNNLEAEGYLKAGTLREFAEGLDTESASALLAGESDYLGIALKMREKAGNEYKNISCGEFDIRIVATQYSAESEKDSFDENYDSGAQFPVFKPADVNLGVKTQNGIVTEDAYKKTGNASMKVPAGTKTTKDRLGLTVSEMATSSSNVTLEENEIIRPLDVHVDGVASDNTKAIIITLDEAMMTGLNIGNYKLYHVEDGVANLMTAVSSLDELDAHNEFYYDPATGNVSLAMATFSEVAVVADTENAWEGKDAETFAGGTGTESDPYIIANADQMVHFSKMVSKDTDGNYHAVAHYKLISDINFAGDVAQKDDRKDLMFYPVGYWNALGTNKQGEEYYGYSQAFMGTFDGNGHTISNIYQNTWLMDGDYDAGYWDAAMGIFGYVYGGTVKNLTVDNFSSDGEFTPTGCVAAYACNSAFENIAITNCNPRVYNTGNGGIVGIGGNSDDPDTYKLTFTNITIDKTNKITALWGSWDVACGGLVGMFRGAGHVYMTNCHIGAQIDVYNDVCGNYQYYWYRYSGMMIGTNKNMITDKDGYTVPETSKFHAEGCTVHFGDWNDYYYCELVANSLASYTHDHQFSRLTQIQNVSEIQDANGNWNKTGNYILMNGKTPTETCYHIMKDANGNLYEHKHDVADATNPNVNETVNGETVLKENNQRIYLPFNQLFTGYGWGVKHIPIYNDGTPNPFDGVTILDRKTAESVEKFEGKVTELANNKKYKFSDIFNFVDKEVELIPGALTVTVTNLDENNPVSATIEYDRTNWENGTITLTGAGKVQITIQDYYFCTPTTITVNVTERASEVKFDVVMNNGDFLHRVGNVGTVALDKLFKAKDGVTVGTVSVTVEAVDGTGASGTYSNNAIQFNGTGVVKVTITDNDYCTPTELYLEVVDAVNATTATSATSNNVVLLNDCGFSSLEVSGGYTLYGNGFTMTCGSDSPALDMGYAFVTLNNGTLDNVQIVCPNFDYAVLYKSNMTESGNRSQTTDRTRYYNVKSGVMVSGNSQILNSRISGARAAVNVSSGNCLIENSRLEGGAVASLLIGAANSVTLRDVTLVQKPTASTYDPSKTLMGFSVLIMCNTGGTSTPITLEGTLVQNAWVDESDKQYVPEDAQDIITTVMKQTNYLHDLDGDGTKESLNLGIAYMPADGETSVQPPDITDNRSNKDTIPYGSANVSYSLVKTYVYSYNSSNGTADSFKNVDDYVPNKQGDIITVTYSDTIDGLESGKSFGTDGWVYELNVDLDKASGYKLDFSKLSMTVNGTTVTDFKVNGAAKPTSPVAVISGGVTYTLTATIDGKDYTATFKVTGTETSKESPSLVAANYEAGLCVASSYGGTWHGAAPALEGIQIKYWSVAEKQYKTINLSDYTPTTKGQQNGTNTTWTYSPANGDFTLTLTGGQVHSSNNVYAMPVVCNNKLYFVAADSKGLVNSGNSARTIPVSYSFKDNNGGDVLTFSHTWSVAENKNDQYKYSDFCKGTLTKLENCITADTLITLANGTQVRVDSLTGNEELLVWNMETGMLDKAPIMFVDSDPECEYEIVHLYFSDGTDVKVIYEHGFWDYDLNKYVYLDSNAAEYIGHTFAKQNGDKLEKVQLVDVVIETEVTTAWSPVTAGHLCYFVNGMLSMPGGVGGLFNIFDVDPETMTYDYEQMEKDIATYGLYTYEELNALCPLSEDMFNMAGGAYLKISIAKGNLTEAELINMINRYSKFFE